ncbi:MAG TPA: alpha-L-fucosidase [Puia sp.]
MNPRSLFLAGMVAACLSVKAQPVSLPKVMGDAEKQTQLMLQELKARESMPDSSFSPRTLVGGKLKCVSSRDWTAGFFPGELWLFYQYTGDESWKKEAEAYTAHMEREKLNGGTHDMGFKIYCSYGNGYRLTQDPAYKQVIIQAARTLSTRFNPKVGCIRSWDQHKELWEYPVIIDNMMNLELLFEATKLTGDSSFYKIAVSHANTTMRNHYRADYSSFHVVDYDPATGAVRKRMTWQGYSDSSAWARGQAWGLYGYTMCYRETGDKTYLRQAEHIAGYIIPRLPKDKVPYWDFNAPGIPDEPRDASAAAILASGLYELSRYSGQGKEYRRTADEILGSLTDHYRSPVGANSGFILLHSTGSKPSHSEVDVPINYADYYYLEALLRSAAGPAAGTAGSGGAARDKRMQWWREARFGMFIHWGVYAVPAGTYDGHRINKAAEWIMNRGKIPVAEYQRFARQFNPVKYNPEAWVKMARDAGMKYIVITAKHHDGFALFKTSASKWNVVDATPYGKDLLKPLAAACRKYGIRLGFYYSQAQDWNNPGGAASRKVASEGWANPDSARIDAYTASHRGHWDPAQTTDSMGGYIDKVAVPEVRELLTHYGDVAVLWWDTPTDMTDAWAEKLHALLSLQPKIITNDRLKRPGFPGDYKTPEQKIPNLSELDGKDWETCMTMNGSWGYKSYDNNWKTPTTLIHNLVDIASKGGNYLLNVGPTAEGEFPQGSVDALRAIGAWMKVNSEAIYDTKASPFGLLPWGRCTKKPSGENTVLYLSVFDWPADGKLTIPGLKNAVVSAKLLAGGAALKTSAGDEGLVLHVPVKAPDAIASVIRMEVKGVL